MKSIQSYISETKAELSPLFEGSEADQVIFMLLEEVKGFSRTDLFSKATEQLSPSDEERLYHFVEELNSGMPVQYVLGYAWFCGMKFVVNDHVLIPRPETEELCDWLLSHISTLKSQISILDIGTGSGCIAITLKKSLPDSTVHAFDISPDALRVAKQNAELNQAEIIFQVGDILSEEFQKAVVTKFDIIVSNPPYVSKCEMKSMADHVKLHEPHTALFVEDDDPLKFYRSIATFAKSHLKAGGKLFFEINERLGIEVKDLLRKDGFKNVEVKRDISGKERMVCACDL